MLTVALARHLAAHIVGLTFAEDGPGGNVFVEHMPSTPDRAVALFTYGGVEQPTLAPVDIPLVQVRVRSIRHDPRPGWERAREIYDVLAGLDNVWLDPAGDARTLVHSVTPLQSTPVGLGQDQQGRHEWALNFRLRVHNPTRHRPPYAPV